MKYKVKHVEIHEVQDIDKETEILQQLSKYRGSLITQANKDSLLLLKKEFIEWLRLKNLDYLFDISKEKTTFEWFCVRYIIKLLESFDTLIEEHDKVHGKPINTINECLRQAMESFSDIYKDKLSIEKAYYLKFGE